MGRAFGNLTRVRHVITYSLSPFEQRAFPHYFTKGIPNVLRRIQASILRSAPPFVAFYLLYTWGPRSLKNPRGRIQLSMKMTDEQLIRRMVPCL